MAGLFVSGAVLLAIEQSVSSEQFGYLLLASLPAFAGGITEDATKNVGVLTRLLLTMLAAAFGVWLLGAVIPRLDIPGFDILLKWAPFAIAFTMFAVGGVANSINIIDGYNGLAAGHAVIVLAAIAWVSALVGDSFLFTSALAMIGALLGFLAWNYPKGKIFLGDGGAYLLGFWLAELSVLLVVRHPEVSPWFPMLLLVYPIFETLFSMYRRKVIQRQSPGQPDRMHLHQVIYMRLTQTRTDTSDPASSIRLNSMVAPFGWLMTLSCAVPALFFWGRRGGSSLRHFFLRRLRCALSLAVFLKPWQGLTQQDSRRLRPRLGAIRRGHHFLEHVQHLQRKPATIEFRLDKSSARSAHVSARAGYP